jgi:hypothetical protein
MLQSSLSDRVAFDPFPAHARGLPAWASTRNTNTSGPQGSDVIELPERTLIDPSGFIGRVAR